MYGFVQAWCNLSIRNSPFFLAQLRAEALKINPIPQPTSPTVIPAGAPTARRVATPSAAEPYIPLAVPTPSTEASTSTTAAAKAVTSNPAGMKKSGPPKKAARNDTPANPAPSRPAASMPAASKPAASKPAVAQPKKKSRPKPTSPNTKVHEDDSEDSFDVNWEPDDNVEDDDELIDEDYEPRDKDNAEGSGGNKRRQPVKLDVINKPPCDRCIRGKRICYKEVSCVSCYSCVKLKCKCSYTYAKSGHKVVPDREELEMMVMKKKGKVRALESRRVFVGDDIEDSFKVHREPDNNIEEDDDQPDDEQPDENNDQPAEGSGGNKRRRRQPANLAAIHVIKSKCDYARSGHKEVSEGRDVKEVKGKEKEKVGTLRSSRVFVGDEIEDSFKVNRDPDNNIVEDDEQPDENNDQPTEGSGGYNRRRRQPVELAAIHEVSGERDVKEMKGKEKEVGTPRSSRVFVGDEIDLLDWESKVSFVVPEDENEMEIKQLARRMKPASRKRKFFIH